MKKAKALPYIWFGPIITLIIMLILYAVGGIYPFGSATTAYGDGLAQYIPFLSEFAEKIKTGSSLFFSFHAGNGVNFWADIAYYLASPLNLTALFYSPDKMDCAFSLITLIKPVLMALTMGIFLKYGYKKNDLSIVIFSLLWAFSGFMISGMIFTAWYDSIIYFPLVILGLKRLMDGKSAVLYTLFLGLSIISNFYIGWMICIFSVLYFIYSFIADDEVAYEGVTAPADKSDDESINIFAVLRNSYILGSFFKFAFSSLLAGALSAVITLPVYKSLSATGKGEVHFHHTLNTTDFWGFLASHIFPAKNIYATFSARDYIFAFAGISVCILAVAYFFAKGISVRKKAGTAFLLAVMWASMYIHPVTNFWHGFGEPAGIMYRFAFIYSFILIITAYEAFINIEKIPVWGVLSGTVFALICTAGLYFNGTLREIFFSPYLIAVVCGSIAVFTAVLLICSKKVNLQKTMTVVLLGAVIIETVALNYKNINTFEFSENLGEYKEVQNAAQHLADSDSLAFVSGKQDFKNMIMYGQLFGCNSMDYYSSMADENFTLTASRLGSYSNRLNYQNGAQEQTPVFNLLFPTAYYLDGAGGVNESFFREKVCEERGYTLYKNNFTMPFMYTVNYNVENWDPISFIVPVDAQNEGVKAITGTDENVLIYNESQNFRYENCRHISIVDRMTEVYKAGGEEFPEDARKYYEYMESKMQDFSYEVLNLKKPASVTFDSVAQADGIMYAFIDTKEFTDVSVTLNSKTTDYYCYGIDNGRVFEIGNVKAGDRATLTFEGSNIGESSDGNYYFRAQSSFSAVCFTVDSEKFENAYNKLDSMSDTEILEFKDGSVKAKIASFTDGALYIPTPYDEGWTVLIDGEKVPLYKHHSHILMTNITQGEHTVEMKYTPAGFTEGAVITGVSAVLLIAWAVVTLKRSKKEDG